MENQENTEQVAEFGSALNQQLDQRNQEIVAALTTSRLALLKQTKRPLVGDLVIWPDGSHRRISHDLDDSLQTAKMGAGSYFVFASGHASFSGTLMPNQMVEFFEKTNEIVPETFWFFSHNRSGAGRGVHCTLPCRVWRLVPFKRSMEEATVHPTAVRTASFWGAGHTEHQKRIESIMNPRVIDKPAQN